MTQIDIAALVADREAGTKGPWFAESGHVQQNGQLYWQVTDGSDAIVQNQFCWCQGNHDANARRIASVPDLEDALIEQAETIKRLTEALVDAQDAMIEVKREMWRDASARWTMADFLGWAIIQKISSAIQKSRAELEASK